MYFDTTSLYRRMSFLTTRANLLNVSRPYLVKLLEQGELNFTKVGTHRRIQFEDLMAYKRMRREQSERAMEELVEQAQEENLGY